MGWGGVGGERGGGKNFATYSYAGGGWDFFIALFLHFFGESYITCIVTVVDHNSNINACF